jgi:hypothetical protein
MRKTIVFLLCLVFVCVIASAGCIGNFSDNSTHSLNPVKSVGELRGLYLNYVDEKSGESWWVDMKTKVGSSVLSIKGPNISVSNMELTDEKREILEAALRLCELSINPGTGIQFGKTGLFNQSANPGLIIREYFIPETLGNSPKDLQFWAEYSMSRYPYLGTGGISAAEWKGFWPVLRDALFDAAGNQA